ncbi:MAG: hemerythrin domain-containing protein [Magnetospirillum sp.]|nr:hemerythrin domain-containing protein [Magnetospirillum sp.]
MRKTDHYRKHHDDLRGIVSRLEPMLDVGRITAAPASVSAVVLDLFGKFSIHLAIEDGTLYPKCASHADSKLRQIAASFQAEMGTLKARFDSYKRDWAGPLAIGRDPAGFVAATREILGLLKARVEREEHQLYDLIDQAA